MSARREIARLRALSRVERRLLARALMLLAVYAPGVRLAGLRRARSWFRGLRAIENATERQAVRIAFAVVRRAPWRDGCLPAALMLGTPEVDIDYISGTREMRGATVRTTDPDGKPITVKNTPLRTLYLAAGSGYVNDGTWGHGVYQGPLKVEGVVHDLSDPEVRRRYAILNETLCRFELDTGEVGYGMHENLFRGVHRPTGFLTADSTAP